MQEVMGALDNRERAILAWAALGLILTLYHSEVRSGLLGILGTLCSRSILVVFGGMLLYVSIILSVGAWLDLWNTGMAKDTLIWFLGPALVMVFKYDRANKEPNYFKTALLSNLRLALILEFLVNFYVLPLYLELLLVPLLFFIGVMMAFSELKKEYVVVKSLMQFLMAAIGLLLLTYAAVNLAVDLDSFASEENLGLFVLPVALTILFLPFIYALAVYTAYESIFVRIKIWHTDPALARHVRRQVLSVCLFRLSRINRFLNDYVVKLPTIRSRSDTAELMAEFRTRL